MLYTWNAIGNWYTANFGAKDGKLIINVFYHYRLRPEFVSSAIADYGNSNLRYITVMLDAFGFDLGTSSFDGQSTIERITIRDEVKSIGDRAFTNMASLQVIKFLAASVI
jgi:hypothetical protein